ncbi:glutamine amidotransferase [uncultured Cellulomonas sp.]|uniref:glutamine amidotransferase n=1 Tax=uncultured Cellulomonas sp. TaxID=189682 RepID=UPI002629321B|nr:glutamine amidotransferase [uncultured Cellulomonas sp.]
MRPFLLLSTRADADAAAGEYEAFRRFGGLAHDGLHQIRLEQGPLPALDLAQWSGVVVGGSPFCTSDPEDEKSDVQRRVERELAVLLDVVAERDIPFLGACYGIGTLGVHQGGVVDRTYGEPVGAVPVTLTADGRADPVFGVLPPVFDAFVGHKEALAQTPPHAVVLASSPGCPVQAFRVRRNLYATQFHPELDVPGIVDRVRIYSGAGYFPADDLERVVDALQTSHVVHPPRLLTAFVHRYAR